MSPLAGLTIERIDDVPLLLAQLERMRIQPVLDLHFPAHGNWHGLSLGWVVTLWLTHLLSQGDHRLNQVEPWAVGRLETLCQCTGQPVHRLDLADDHLAVVLDALANDYRWATCEAALTASLLRVYDLEPTGVRLDTTTVSSYRPVSEEGLFQLGQSKDGHPDLPQVKVALATLDPLGMPLATAVVAGQRADDPLYVPAIRRVRASVGRRGLLYVGDCKMAALATRAMVAAGGDYYLCPLPTQLLPPEELDRYLEPVWDGTQPLEVVTAADEEQTPLAHGYERTVSLTARVDGQPVIWTERRLVLRSLAQAKSEEAALRDRIAQTVARLEALNERGPGKRRPRDRDALGAKVAALRSRYHVEALIDVTITETVVERPVRRYRGRPARVESVPDWQVTVRVVEPALAAVVRRLGWRVYVTNAPGERLPLSQSVAAYRGQYQIERGFGRMKGRPLSLTPVYLQHEARVVGLIRLLSLALRVLCLIEFVVRRGLAAAKESLAGLYAGQPKRATAQPTSEALLRAFREINLVRMCGATATEQQITPLSALQQRILALLELPPDTYTRLILNSAHSDSR
jgi:transposase